MVDNMSEGGEMQHMCVNTGVLEMLRGLLSHGLAQTGAGFAGC